MIFGSVGPKYEVIHQFWDPLLKKTPRTGQKTKNDGKMSFFLCFFVKIEDPMIYLARKTMAYILITITEVKNFASYALSLLLHEK